jgi:hypothetical protein
MRDRVRVVSFWVRLQQGHPPGLQKSVCKLLKTNKTPVKNAAKRGQRGGKLLNRRGLGNVSLKKEILFEGPTATQMVVKQKGLREEQLVS